MGLMDRKKAPEEQPLLSQSPEGDLEEAVPAEEEEEKKKLSVGQIVGLSLAVISTATINRVLFKRMLFPMAKHVYFVNQLSTFIYIPVFILLVYLRNRSGHITDSMKAFSKKAFVIMGALDSTAGIVMVFGAASTSGPLQQLLLQGAVPATMLCSIIMLKVKYNMQHYLGALVIMCGIGVSLIYPLTHPSGAATTVTGIVLMLLALPPTAISGVYKEKALTGQPMDIFYLNFWVSVFQFCFGLCLLPLNALPAFGGVTFPEMPALLWDGALCYFGKNSVPGDLTCDQSMLFVSLYFLANITYNCVIIATLQKLGAAYYYVCSAIVLPLADIAFTFHFIMGDNATALNMFDMFGLGLIICGLAVYRTASKGDDDEGTTVFGDGTSRVVFAVVTNPFDEARKTPHHFRAGLYARLGMPPSPRFQTTDGPRSAPVGQVWGAGPQTHYNDMVAQVASTEAAAAASQEESVSGSGSGSGSEDEPKNTEYTGLLGGDDESIN